MRYHIGVLIDGSYPPRVKLPHVAGSGEGSQEKRDQETLQKIFNRENVVTREEGNESSKIARPTLDTEKRKIKQLSAYTHTTGVLM